MNTRGSWSRVAAACLTFGVLFLAITTARAHEEREHQRRAWLGVMLHEGEAGATVVGVTPDSPAATAGIKKGDRITAVDGQTIGSVSALVDAIRSHEPDDRVTLSIAGEDGATREVTATLGESDRHVIIRRFEGPNVEIEEMIEGLREGLAGLPEALHPMIEGWTEGETGEPAGFLGVALIQPSDDLRRALGGREGVGVLVNEVVDDAPAATAGIAAGDLILRVDGETIDGTSSLTRIIRAHKPGDVVRIELLRDRQPRTFDATLAETEGLRRFQFFAPGAIHGIGGTIGDSLDGLQIELDSLKELEQLRALPEQLKELEHLELPDVVLGEASIRI